MGCSALRLTVVVAVLCFWPMANEIMSLNSLKHQREKRSVKHNCALDVSVKETAVCIVDESGKICQETEVATWREEASLPRPRLVHSG